MSPMRRVLLCGLILTCGLAAQASLESYTKIERPPLRRSLATLPYELGNWVGRDKVVDPAIVKEAQATEYLSRIYESPDYPGRRLDLWINYSDEGLNLRHSPEICLPSGGWTKIESVSHEISVPSGPGKSLPIMRLGYSQRDLVMGIGFWYYIFGEGKLERYVRGLPITSRSSHGRTTRGSGLTVEVFCSGESDPDGKILKGFATALLSELEPILPEDRAEYFIP
ncbi:EpsI family protein [Singulisphaera sp. Ch08]|uniref:EpsI family protein n=1 Tax=Singulisphaera sp. Ch08 TaxID=3120278 RepID=A0AAU7CQU4_9BACT